MSKDHLQFMDREEIDLKIPYQGDFILTFDDETHQ